MGAYLINLDHSKSIGTHRMTLYVNANSIANFDSFGLEQFLKL